MGEYRANYLYVRPRHLAQDLQQGAFAGAVLADDAEHFAFLYFEVDVAQGPDVFAAAAAGAVVGFADLQVGVFLAAYAVPPAVEVVGDGTGADLAEAVLFGEVFYFDDGIAHVRFRRFRGCEAPGLGLGGLGL